MCNALLPALEASNRIPSERGSDAFKVLLAEDNVVNQKVAMKFLESAGHQTEIVENGVLALEAVKKNFYDVSCSSFSFAPNAHIAASTDRHHGRQHARYGRDGGYSAHSFLRASSRPRATSNRGSDSEQILFSALAESS